MSEMVEIHIDVHEMESEVFDAISARDIGAVIMKSLKAGDVVLRYREKTVSLEIKRGSDFSNSLKEGRLQQQICKMLDNYDFCLLVVEDWHPYVSDSDDEDTIKEKVRLHKMIMRTLNRRISVTETKHLSETVDLIEEIVRDMKAGKFFCLRRPIILEDVLDPPLKVICGFPQISRARGEEILLKYSTLKNAIEHMDEWPEMKIGITEERLAKIREAWED